ncbi:MAG TPA: hypothetical protein DEO85_14665 [Maritimibacter sp.]|nr:hypothetical protein [Maritimibacter sp.]
MKAFCASVNFDAFMRFRSSPSQGNVAENYSFKRSNFQGAEQSKPGVDYEAENRRLKRELARVTEERDIPKNCSGPQPACARYKQPVLCCARRAVADGLLVGWTPLINVAHGPMRT